MNEKKLKNKVSPFFKAVPGFTARLERQIEYNNPNKENVDLENIMTMPTYSFAILALENDSPLQVIKVMEAMRKRYASKPNVSKNVMGFLDCVEGKAYGYIALNVTNVELKYNFYKLSCKCFKNAMARGYNDAALDLADLESKLNDVYAGEATALKAVDKCRESFTKLGDLFYDFDMLVENAIRVLENKRPIIEDDLSFWYALCKYKEGSGESINSRLRYGLALIINDGEGEKEAGLKLVKDSFEDFKKANSNRKKTFFASDVKAFDKTLQLLETKIVKVNNRQ
jgi:hypothetical protein